MFALEEKILCQQGSNALQARAWPIKSTLVDSNFGHLNHVLTTVYTCESRVRELLRGVKCLRQDYLLKVFLKCAEKLSRAITSVTHYDAVLPIPIDPLKRMQRHFIKLKSSRRCAETASEHRTKRTFGSNPALFPVRLVPPGRSISRGPSACVDW